ncbi:UDP-glucose 4-epimerase GalE [Bdellovibrio sp. HCB2-146]|uniref:UDP-glucose 4-epimerase GalE n=1 Tax=Bdellovibrio sp. HCB2-146 TaxID=3394362 RepID=UPI0039BD7B4B
MKVLVTGGAGYIGSHVVRDLIGSGHEVVVLDNLSHGHLVAVDPRAQFVKGSISDYYLLESLFTEEDIEAVAHLAGFIEVSESVADPAKYYQNNFSQTLILLEAMKNCHIRKIVFSSTAAVYGEPEFLPITESHRLQPKNPYGRSKLMVENILSDFAQAYEISYIVLRYFNAAGAHPDSTIGEDHPHETHLIPRILKSALTGKPEVRVFGTDYETSDGTCVRDYIHVSDLAKAHTLALEKIEEMSGNVYNLGSEKGFSVHEVIMECQKVTGINFSVIKEERRAGDPAVLIASSEKIFKDLGWTRRYSDLGDIIQHAWDWHRLHPIGYKSTTQQKPAWYFF